MTGEERVLLYGDTVFLAGLKAELQGQCELALVSGDEGREKLVALIRSNPPRALLFDLAAEQPDFAIALLREHPNLLLIGVDPCSDELLVLSNHPHRALHSSDLLQVIEQHLLAR